MILPSGINKATGLKALLHSLHLSLHNTVSVGDAENDSALLQAGEAAVAVNNALPALKAVADWVTTAGHGEGVSELIDQLMENDLSPLNEKLGRHYLELGKEEERPFAISPYRSGILLSGVSGGGKTTFTVSIVESLISKGYQFCLIDPEGDYQDLPESVVLGSGSSAPSIDEIKEILKDPTQNLVICMLSVPLSDRPAFFARLMPMLLDLRHRYSHPHWILMDEAHHLLPSAAGGTGDWLPDNFNNFILISTSPHALCSEVLSKVGMLITIGNNSVYPFEQFCGILGLPVPEGIPFLAEDEICVWEREGAKSPYAVKFRFPRQLQQRHKKKYAVGDMGDNSFVFTGREHQLCLRANNLILFIHIAEGIDTDTWLFHLQRQDYTKWFRESVHDEELAKVSEEAEALTDPVESRKHIVDFISGKYTL